MSLDLVSRLVLDTKQYDRNLERSKQNLMKFKSQSNGFFSELTNSATKAIPQLGNLGGMIGKLSPHLAAAAAAYKLFSTRIHESEGLMDKFNVATEQAKAANEELFHSFANLDNIRLDGLLDRLKTVLEITKDITDAIDRRGTLNMAEGYKIEQAKARMTKASADYKDAAKSGDVEGMEKAKVEYKKAKKLYDDTTKKVEQTYLTERAGYIRTIDERFTEKGLKPYTGKAFQNLMDGYMVVKDMFEPFGNQKEKTINYTDFNGRTVILTLKEAAKLALEQNNKGTQDAINKGLKNAKLGFNVEDLKRFYILSDLSEDEDGAVNNYFKTLKELNLIRVQRAEADAAEQKLFRSELSASKENNKTTTKNVKTLQESAETFESVINRMKSSNDIITSQYKGGFMTLSEYTSALQDNLEVAIRTLMSDKMWTTLTDTEKEELLKMRQSTDLLDKLNNELKNDGKNNKEINTDLTDLSDIYTNLDILKKGKKSAFFGRLENSDVLSEEGATNQAQRNISDNIYDLYYQRYGTKLPDYKNGELAEILTDGSGIFNNLSDEAQEYYGNLDIYAKKNLDDLMLYIKRGLPNVTAFQSKNMFEADETLFYQQNPSANRMDFLKALVSASEKSNTDLDEINKGYQSKIDEKDKERKALEDSFTLDLDESAKEAITEKLKELDDEIKELIKKIEKNKLTIGVNVEKIENAKNEIDDIDKTVGGLNKKADGAKKFSEAFGSVSYAFSSAGDAAEEFGDESAGAALKMVGIGAQLMSTIAGIIGSTLSEAAANAVNSASKIGYPQNIIAIGSALGAVMAAVAQVHSIGAKKYAHGGIVEGIGSSFSDSIPIMVSNGEMVLNKGQQRNLFNLLDRGEGASSLSSGDVTFRIKGNVMEGTLKNHNSQMRKIR